MIYQDTKRFLKQHLKQPSSTYIWDNNDNIAMFKFLQKRYSDDHIDNNAMEIREAFRHFLEPVGNALVRYTSLGISYKVFPYHLEPAKSRHLKSLIHIIHSHRRCIDFPHNGREDQIALLGRIRRAMNAEIVETDENVNKRELVRYAIKEALGLGERDVVLTLKKKYIIKLFHENSFVSTPEAQRAELLNIISEFQLQSDYEELFRDTSIEYFIDQVMASLFHDSLNFSLISNQFYEQNASHLIQKEIAKQLEEYLSYNEEYLQAFAAYIFKQNMLAVYERIAIEIFEKITSRDSNARQFLNYYTGHTYVENGKRYIIPDITTEDGKRWNINSLISTSNIWLRSRNLLLQSKVELKNCEKRIDSFTPDYSSAKNALDALMDEIRDNKRLSEMLEDEMLSLNGKISPSRYIKKEAHLRAQAQEYKKRFKDTQQKINTLVSQKIHKEKLFLVVQGRLLDNVREKKILLQKIHALEKELAMGSDSFNSILSSVVKALMKRKSEVDTEW